MAKNQSHREQGELRGSVSIRDGENMPYRAYIPSTSGQEQAFPTIVALHGIMEDEEFFFRVCGWNFLTNLADQHGFLLLTPRISRTIWDKMRMGRRGIVAPLIEKAKELLPIAEDRLFLLGHSMGSFEAWREGARNPACYTALACLAGAPPVFHPSSIRELPLFLGVGTRDYLLPLVRSAAWIARTFKLAHFHYREVNGIDHVQIVRELMPTIFSWYAKKRPEQGSNL